MYDNFDLPKCAIVEESYPSDNKAEIKFIAEMIYRETGEVTAFMETSTFERSTTDGRWLYRSGIVEPVPDELTGAWVASAASFLGQRFRLVAVESTPRGLGN